METPDRPLPASPTPRLSLDELGALALGVRPGRMPLRQLYFGISGRLSRAHFWLHGVLVLMAAAVLLNAGLDIAGLASDRNGKMVNLILAWPTIAVTAKRLHDFNRSAWWMLVNFVPAIGSLLVLIAAGGLRGTAGPNDYGRGEPDGR